MHLSKLMIDPPIIAHRGACRYAPENTLAAFRKAKELGINWVEFDVMLTSDEEAVVIHDETLERTTSGKGRVIDFVYADLKILDAGSWFNTSFNQERIPTLTEIIQLLISLEMNANIEIKAQKGLEAKTVRKVLNIVDTYWTKKNSPPLISSFSTEILKKVREISSSHLIGFLIDKWQKDWRRQCDALDAIAVDVNHTILTPKKVESIKETGRSLLAYTVNEPARAAELYSWGVDAVFSDCPDEILKNIANIEPNC